MAKIILALSLIPLYIIVYIFFIRESFLVHKTIFLCRPCVRENWASCDWKSITPEGKHRCFNWSTKKFSDAKEVNYYDVQNEIFLIALLVVIYITNCFIIFKTLDISTVTSTRESV